MGQTEVSTADEIERILHFVLNALDTEIRVTPVGVDRYAVRVTHRPDGHPLVVRTLTARDADEAVRLIADLDGPRLADWAWWRFGGLSVTQSASRCYTPSFSVVAPLLRYAG